MSINDASPEMWNKLREKYGAMADEEKTEMENDEWLPDDDRQEYFPDPVNAPQHYNSGNIECIEAIQESMPKEAYKGYLKGNCLKYLWRYDYKGKPSEDLEKAGWYLNRLIREVS